MLPPVLLTVRAELNDVLAVHSGDRRRGLVAPGRVTPEIVDVPLNPVKIDSEVYQAEVGDSIEKSKWW